MKVIVYFVVLLSLTHATPTKRQRHYDPREEDKYRIRYLPYLDKDGNVQYEDLLADISSNRATASDVNFYLYTQSNKDTPTIIGGSDINALASSNFDANKKNIFISHGWNNDYSSSVNVNIRTAVLNVLDVNVFVVDWSDFTNGLYLTAYSNVQDVGNVVGDYIVSMMNTYGLGSDNFHLIGHSLGAHVVGCAGSRVNSNTGSLVYSIVGLDPAGPLFTIGNTDNRVDPTDGDFVHIIHTSGLLGFSSAIGDADYYPNGGSSQNGCGIDLIGTCAHSRAHIYYAESVETSGFVATRCDSYSNYNNGGCSGNAQSLMGEFLVDKTASGDYYLSTNDDSLYAQG